MSGNQPPDPLGIHFPSWEDANPYKPPSAAVMPPGNHRPPFKGMRFGHRLLLLPLWFLAATIPTAVVFIFLNLLAGQAVRNGNAVIEVLILFAAAFLPSFLRYRWLVRPFKLDRRALCLWAWMEVPLVAVAWGAFLTALAAVILGLSGYSML